MSPGSGSRYFRIYKYVGTTTRDTGKTRDHRQLIAGQSIIEIDGNVLANGRSFSPSSARSPINHRSQHYLPSLCLGGFEFGTTRSKSRSKSRWKETLIIKSLAFPYPLVPTIVSVLDTPRARARAHTHTHTYIVHISLMLFPQCD